MSIFTPKGRLQIHLPSPLLFIPCPRDEEQSSASHSRDSAAAFGADLLHRRRGSRLPAQQPALGTAGGRMLAAVDLWPNLLLQIPAPN